jgi:hypothetical protein
MAFYHDYFKKVIHGEFANSQLWGFKDPRACRLLPIWRDLFNQWHVHARYVLVVRPPEEIAASLSERGGVSYNQALLSTLLHMLRAESNTRGALRVVVPYGKLLEDWRGQVEWIGTALGIAWPNPPEKIADQVSSFLDPSMRHYVSRAENRAADAVEKHGADPLVAKWVFSAYDLLAAAAPDPATIDQSSLDRIAADMESERLRLSAWRSPKSNREKITKVQTMAARLDQDIKRLLRENQELRSRLAH